MASIVATWPMVALGEVLIQRKQFIQIDDLATYKRCRVQLHAQGIVLRDTAVGAEIKTKSQQVCHAGEFLVAEIDAKVGGFGIVPCELEGAIVSSHYFLFRIDDTKLDRSFLDYFVRTHAFWDQVNAQGSTNYAAIRPSDVLSYIIPLPPLDEQRRIVARIEALAHRIEQARGLRREAEEMVSNFVSSTHLALACDRVVSLANVLTLDEQQEVIVPGAKYPQVGIKGFGGGLFDREAVEAGQTTYRAFNRLYAGAIVLSQVKGWEGAIAVCDQCFAGKYASPEYRTFRCNPQAAVPEYMAALVATPWFWSQLQPLTRGVGARRERTRPEQFLALEMPMPTVEQQHQAIRVFAQLESIKRLQAETAAELDALLPSILDRAFRGEL
jgi:type I restriction enzyme S subunit